MRRCQRIGCENSLDHLRPGAIYCGPTCKREAARARAISRDETGAPGFWDRYRLIQPARRSRTRHTTIMAVLAVALLALAGCGGTKTVTSTSTVTSTTSVSAQPCPPGKAFAGCASEGVVPPKNKLRLAPIAGPEFPDVYEGQGNVDWAAVKQWQVSHGWAPGGVFKIGEFRFDHQAAANSSEMAKLGMWRIGYWFVRNTGCSHEAALIHQGLIELHLNVLALDVEVPEAAGYTTCLVPALRPFVAHIVIYTGCGTWPGGNAFGLAMWNAAYNFTGPCTVGLWRRDAIAWQFTDGQFAAVTKVPGISGFDDVNVDLGGIAKLANGQPPPPPDPFRRFDRAKRHFTMPDESEQVASEHTTMKKAVDAGCRKPVRRKVCRTSLFHLQLLLDRLDWLKRHVHHSYRWDDARYRHARIAAQIQRMR